MTYTYDALGRLVKVDRSGTINDGASASYGYDPASNRTNVTVTTSGGGGGSGPSFSVNDVSVTEGGSLSFTVTKSGTASGTVTVNYATANGTASAGSDYTAASNTLSFTTSQTTQTVSVSTIDDASVESFETVVLNLSNATGGATISDSQGTGTITDNDSAPSGCTGVSFAVSDASAVEGTSLQFTVTKTGSTSSSCGVSYATADGVAVQPADYTAKSGTLTFSAAQTSLTVNVTTILNADTIAEETMYLNLTPSGDGSTISDPQGIGTILWEDPNPCPLC